MTIQDIAEHLQLGWDTVKEIVRKNLQRRFGKPKLRKLKQIAIDEINIGKGHRYLTIVKFANTLEEHQEGILNYYDYPISTGPMEGTDNKIKLLQRKAYGYRDPEFFKLKTLGAHETRHALVG